ncbi:MAG: LamG domain-containing protein [Armatimonadetes bacterium]|nr:LamG domain-containing protein [Armatimonadota bacterium]
MCRTLTLVGLLLTVGLPAQEGPILRYACDEGEGAILRDSTGGNHEGRVEGATFEPFGEGWALRLDGVDDFVDCGVAPDLDLRGAVSVEAWVYPEALPAGEAGIVGKDYESYVLTYYRDGQAWWYIAGGGNNCHAPLALNAWHHVVGTFDGELLRLYVDGRLAGSKTSSTSRIAPGGNLWIGKSAGTEEFTRGAHFCGQVDEVRLYDRALTPDEVREHHRSTHLSHELGVSVRPYPYMKQLLVRIDPRGLGALEEGAQAEVTIRRAGAGRPLVTTRLGPLTSWETASYWVDFDAGAGEHELAARAIAPQPVGRPAQAAFAWPGPAKGERGMRRLNNLVTELLATEEPGRGPWRFENPRDGWVFVRASGSGGTVALQAGEALLALAEGDEATAEAMRWLPQGPHTLTSDAELSRLTVRAIPELLFAKFGANPHVPDFGPYDWPFLQRHVLPNLNTMVGNGSPEQRPFAEEWKGQGKRWIVECMAYGLGKSEAVTADQAEAFWSGNPGMADPLLDGLIVDEFWSGDMPQYPGWTEAVQRMNAKEALRGKSYYPYCGSMYGSPASEAFMRAVLTGGHRFALERYLPEQRGEKAAQAYLDSALTQEAQRWEQAFPGAVSRMVVCFGYFSAPPESLDVDPTVDHKVYLDMQFHLVANDPAFAGVAGLMTYLCSYADEETVRWAGRLFRHYALEGRAERLTQDPYTLPHLANGDFEAGTQGWELTPAEEGGISAGSSSGFSWLEGRYPRTSQGDTFLLLKRSARGPNRVSQAIRRLTAGRLYSLRLFCADVGDLGRQQELGVSARVIGAEVLPDRQIRHVFPNCYSHHLAPYDDKNRAWMNYHRLVFRATDEEATLEIADWPDQQTPGGPVGQPVAVNFVQVQPYDAP